MRGRRLVRFSLVSTAFVSLMIVPAFDRAAMIAGAASPAVVCFQGASSA
jgi:hypothetical protein